LSHRGDAVACRRPGVIRIAVVSHHAGAAGHALAAEFGIDGGTIGRAATNTLVLEDPDRTVSRVHAQVVCRDGRYFVIDRGSNPMLCNGRALGAGNESPLAQGDRLVIGGFELAVQMVGRAVMPPAEHATPATAARAMPTEDDPFADLLAGLAPPAAAPAAHAGRATPPAQAATAPVPEGLPDPFADLLAPPPSAQPLLQSGPSSASPSSGGGGAFDDFSDLAAPGGGKAPSIDSLFGTGGGLGGDPLALSPLADPLHAPNTAATADPLAALGVGAQPTPAPRSDHLPIEQFGFVPPKALSPQAPAPAPAPVPAPAPMAVPAASPRPSAPAAARVPDDVLLAALLRGLQGTHQPPEALTPELMERIGGLLRSATEGTLQLLLTRQEFKREVRAEVTMIAAQANNPLKFSPTVEVALSHLLGPGVRGFMPADEAMRDAFHDLRAHQFGVMVGMRAALAQLIARFAPDELEKKIAAKSALDSLFAANRKAKLWDQFVALYGGIASEAEDDFHTLFGKAFVQAYEEQMARFKSGERS
jgi:FHA domain-containing protein